MRTEQAGASQGLRASQRRGPVSGRRRGSLCVQEPSLVPPPKIGRTTLRAPRAAQSSAEAYFCVTGRDESLRGVPSDAKGSEAKLPARTPSCRRFQSPLPAAGTVRDGSSPAAGVARTQPAVTKGRAVGTGTSGKGRGLQWLLPQHHAFHLK